MTVPKRSYKYETKYDVKEDILSPDTDENISRK